MAVARERDPALREQLRRAESVTLSLGSDSMFSLEEMGGDIDIDAVVNKRWRMDEVIGPLQSKLAFLSGGRDRRGAPIITVVATSEHDDFRPTNVGRLLSYLSKVPDESLQGLGFTVILDVRQASWQVLKRALKSLQLTFAEHIYQVFILKPKAFWQRQKTGVSFTLKKSKYNFAVIALESGADIFQYLQVSQVTSEFGGTLRYDHLQWMEGQRSLERHSLELHARLEGFEHLREQLDQPVQAEDLNEARDGVRRHVEARQLLDKALLDGACEAMSHTVARMQPCSNPDFTACFNRLEDLCSQLQSMRDRLDLVWVEKGAKLDRILQLRVYESDTEQLLLWVEGQVVFLANEHTDIGDSSSSVRQKKQAFDKYRASIATEYREVSRVLQMGERLVASYHFASDVIRGRSIDLHGKWEAYSSLVDDRSLLLSLSATFHDQEQKFFDKSEDWTEQCIAKDHPADIPQAEELLQQHNALRDTFSELYANVRRDGHKIIQLLRKPVGDSSLPAKFITSTRHIKEILESLFDEKNLIEEQWNHKSTLLRQALNLKKFQEESKKVYSWLSAVGNRFLVSNNSIGNDAGATQRLLNKHDAFESETENVYMMSGQLFSQAEKMADSGECSREMIETETAKLKAAVHQFAARLDDRREIILHAFEFYQKTETLNTELKKLNRPIPKERFSAPSREIESRAHEFQAFRDKVDEIAMETFACCESLIARLESITKSTQDSTNYSAAVAAVGQSLETLISKKTEVDDSCDCKARRWNLTIQLVQFQKDVQKHLSHLKSWVEEEEDDIEEYEPAVDTMDAQVQLECFQKGFDQIHSSHSELVSRGRTIAKEIEQLDSSMFGSSDSAHPAAKTVNEHVERLEAQLQKMDSTAAPHLEQLKDCLQFHLLQERAGKLMTALTTLTSTLTPLTGVGHTLEEAHKLLQQVVEANQKMQAVSKDAEAFLQEAEGCVQKGHYEAASLSVLARALKEKLAVVSKTMVDKLRITRASAEFHQNVKKLSSTMERCQAQFSSRETGNTVADIQQLLHTLKELRPFLEQTAEVVQSQGKQLLETVAACSQNMSPSPEQRKKSVELLNSPRVSASPQGPRRASESAAVVSKRGRRADYDHLEGVPRVTQMIREDVDATSSDDGKDSPKLLVNSRKARPSYDNIKPSNGLSSLSPSPDNPEQQIIEGMLQQMDVGLKQLKQLWKVRKSTLEQSHKVVDFIESVPRVVEWVEGVGAGYLKNKNIYGKSIEEVETLIAEYQQFELSEMQPMVKWVDSLRASFRSVEQSGHPQLNETRALASQLEQKWGGFEKEMERRLTKLELSLKFQKTLYQASNWCQKTQQFLNSMEDRIEACETSTDTSSLATELSVYLSATRDEQEERVKQVEHISNYLHSNLLVELANHIAASTDGTVQEFKQTLADLERLHNKLLQIENERDREKRLIKKREFVFEELLQTEEVYVDDLKLIVEKYRPRFVSDLLPNSLKGKEEVIFGNIQQIDTFHREFLLPKLQEHQGDMAATADIFVECAEEMASIYVPFCQSKTASEELLASHRSYLSRVQSLFGTAVPLSSLMIKPVQRITKYPLLLKDALKYTQQLGQTNRSLEEALKAVERIPVATNNAIHLGHLEGIGERLVHDYLELENAELSGFRAKSGRRKIYLEREVGKLLYQGLLHVSEPKFGLKAGKERQVFLFATALVFARKVDLTQAKFKYEYKFKLPISAGLQVVEFLEGEPCKFILTTGDHRMSLKANTLEVKNEFVRALRTIILEKSKDNFLPRKGNSLTVDAWPRDLQVPSPLPSPLPQRRMAANGGFLMDGVESPPGSAIFERYQVKEDFTSEGEHPLTLAAGSVVEVLDNNIAGKWFVRTVCGALDHGWVPSAILEKIPGGDEVDYGGKKKWVQLTSGPLNSSSDEEKWKFLNQTSFGSHDLQSQQVISTLKKITMLEEPKEEVTSQDMTSLDASPLDRGSRSSLDRTVSLEKKTTSLDRRTSDKQERSHLHATRLHSTSLDVSPQASPKSSHRRSPRGSPRGKRRHTDAANSPNQFRRFTEGANSPRANRRHTDEVRDPTQSGDWTKSRWRRKAVIRRHRSDSSDHSESPAHEEGAELISISSEEGITGMAENGDVQASAEVSEQDAEKVQKAQEKIKYIMAELLETEKEYVLKLEGCINGYLKEMQSPNLPDSLKGKEKIIFGNIQSVYEFHNGTFSGLLEEAAGSVEDIARCFIDQSTRFEVYVTYCENKPKSESFLWTYQHTGGTFFEEIQNQLGHREGIDSFLIKPVQRITKYQLLLRDLRKSAQKASMETPVLDKALELMQDVPKRANDAMALSMIYGYEGNIHAYGQIVLQDEFTVYERSRWTGARRHIFLLDQRLIITKEKDADGLYVYKDSLKVHSLTVAEKQGDNPCRFAVGTGPIGTWDQYYVLEASSPERKQQWVVAIKDILKQQFELLKALKVPGTASPSNTLTLTPKQPIRSMTIDSVFIDQTKSVGMINLSDDSEDEEEFSAAASAGRNRLRSNTVPATFGEATPSLPFLRSPRSLNLYIVAEDCAPPKENEGILYIHRGQIFDVIDDQSDWWLARLVRDTTPDSGRVGLQGWIPGSFLDHFTGQLDLGEEELLYASVSKQQMRGSHKGGSPAHARSHRRSPRHSHHSLDQYAEHEEQEEEEEFVSNSSSPQLDVAEAPVVTYYLSDETVIVGRLVQFKCQFSEVVPTPTVEWTRNGVPLNIDRAFISIGNNNCVLRIKGVESGDEGTYTCTVKNEHGSATSTAKLLVLSPPSPPSQPAVTTLTSMSVRLSWTPPTFIGHSPITIYLIECKSTTSHRWSTLMKRVTEPSTVVDDLMPGSEYVFRVIAGNHIGSSEPSAESARVKLPRSYLDTEFSLDPFDSHYELMAEIERGQYSVVYECLHHSTQQTYAAKLLPLKVGQDHAHHELKILTKLSHPNIVQMSSAYLTEEHFIILFQLIRGVNVFDFFCSHDCLTEYTAAGCMEQILAALQYLHVCKIAHLSIKPENILAVEPPDSDIPDIKLVHLERAREVDADVSMVVRKLEDHIEYEAPEILAAEPVSLATDMWSLGVVLYTLLSGVSPFLVDSLDLTKANIIAVRYSFPGKSFKEVSENAKDLITNLLMKDISARHSSTQCLQHAWLQSRQSKSSSKLNISRLKSYLSSRQWQSSLVTRSEPHYR